MTTRALLLATTAVVAPRRSFHIDHVFVSSDLAVASWGVGLHHPWASLSDHAPIVVDVAPR